MCVISIDMRYESLENSEYLLKNSVLIKILTINNKIWFNEVTKILIKWVKNKNGSKHIKKKLFFRNSIIIKCKEFVKKTFDELITILIEYKK